MIADAYRAKGRSGLIGIVADDLTGAADTAAPFARAGLHVRLLVGATDEETANLSATDSGNGRPVQVVALSTDSRSSTVADATEAARSATVALRAAGADDFYKKIDSTLRGNIGAETLAMLDTLGTEAVALVCPAFPSNGRVVVGGLLLVDGVPVARTAVAADPVTPVTSSAVIDCFRGVLGETQMSHLGVDTVGAGAAAVTEFLEATAARVVVADAASDDDLQILAQAADQVPRPTLLTGSAGLAGPFALVRARQQAPSRMPVLVVVGSLHERSRTQLDELRHTVHVVDLPHEDVEVPDAWEALVRNGRDAADNMLAVASPERGEADPSTVARRLGDVAATTALAGVAGIVATGGDTARAVLARTGANGLDVLDEVAPGVSLGRIAGGELGGLPIVTKAGGFGDLGILRTAAEAVRRLQEGPS